MLINEEMVVWLSFIKLKCKQNRWENLLVVLR
jgi:hypothetical protein